MLKRERIVPPKVIKEVAAMSSAEVVNKLAKDSLKVIGSALKNMLQLMRVMESLDIPSKHLSNELANKFLADTREARETLALLAKKEYGRLILHNQLLLKNYQRLDRLIMDKIQVLQLGTESERKIAVHMLDLYGEDLATVNPPPLR
jgi:hypothetical protein